MMPVGATCIMWHSSPEFITADVKVDGGTEAKVMFTSAVRKENILSCKWKVKL